MLDRWPGHPVGSTSRRGSGDAIRGYLRHEHVWIPRGHPHALRFYLNYLIVPHSRRERLRAHVARAAPWIMGRTRPRPDHSVDPQGAHLDGLARWLGTQMRDVGIVFSGPLAPLVVEDRRGQAAGQTVAFLFDQEGTMPCAVAKVARAPDRRDALGRECSALMALSRALGPGLRSTIPRPLGLFQHAAQTVLLETYVPGRSMYVELRNGWYLRRRAAEHFRMAREWLVEFQDATRQREDRFDGARVAQAILGPLEAFLHRADTSRCERELLRTAAQAVAAVPDVRMPLVASQGDFWARNLVVRGRTVGVVDWEGYSEHSGPLPDLFMFTTSYGLAYPWRLGSEADPADAFRATYLEPTWLGAVVRDTVRAYCDAMRIPLEMLGVCFVAFLAARAWEEGSRGGAGAPGGGDRPWRAFLREYARRGGSWCFA